MLLKVNKKMYAIAVYKYKSMIETQTVVLSSRKAASVNSSRREKFHVSEGCSVFSSVLLLLKLKNTTRPQVDKIDRVKNKMPLCFKNVR